MKTRCKFCQELVDEELLKAHLTTVGSSCRAALETIRLLGSGYRPLPGTNSLTQLQRDQLVVMVALTRGKYEGEPRMEKGFLAKAEEQWWVPRWVDIVMSLWSGPVYAQGEIKLAQRDATLDLIRREWTSGMKQRIVDAHAEDLRAVRELLVKWNAILGEPPMLLVEFEKIGGFQDPKYRGT